MQTTTQRPRFTLALRDTPYIDCQDCGEPIEDNRPDLFLCLSCTRDLFDARRRAAMERLKKLMRESDPYHVEGFHYDNPYRASVARGQLIEKLSAEVDRWSANLWEIDNHA